MRLHKAGVSDTVVGGGGSDATLGLLEDNREHKSGADLSLGRNLVDSPLNVVDLLVRVVGTPAVPAAGVLEDVLVGVPELIEGAPLAQGRPALTRATVTGVESVRIRDTSLLDRPLGGGESVDSASKGENSNVGLGEHFEGFGFEEKGLWK